MLDRKKLSELVSELEVLERKIQKEKNLIANLEHLKRVLEIEFEDTLHNWPDEVLMKG